jgi:hypothetical protein
MIPQAARGAKRNAAGGEGTGWDGVFFRGPVGGVFPEFTLDLIDIS